MADMLALKDDTRRHARPSLHAPTASKIAQVTAAVMLHAAVHKSTEAAMGIITDPWNNGINLLAAGSGERRVNAGWRGRIAYEQMPKSGQLVFVWWSSMEPLTKARACPAR